MTRFLSFALLSTALSACITDDEVELGVTASELSGPYVTVYLRDLMVWDTHETGSPEIYVKCTTGSGRSTDKMWFDYINDTDPHIMNKKFVIPGESANVLYESEGYISCKVMESDDTTADDRIGDVTIPYAMIANQSTADTCIMKSEEDIAIFSVSRYAAPTVNHFGIPTPTFCKYYRVAP